MAEGIIAWLIIGAVAGWIAGKIVEGAGFGLIVDIIVVSSALSLAAGSLACWGSPSVAA
jgi:uncharacterized membrane protein YeaQ/YmgE (transglycosylase-associated protein family)